MPGLEGNFVNEQSNLIKAVALDEIIWGGIVDREEGSGRAPMHFNSHSGVIQNHKY